MTRQFETLLSARDDGILTITLNRPDKLNAWTYQMGAELREAILAANADPAVDAMVVTGAEHREAIDAFLEKRPADFRRARKH